MDHPASLIFDAEIYFGRAGQPADSLSEIQRVLEPYRGGNVQVWSYHISHCWLTIRFTRQGVSGNVHLCCGICFQVEFDTDYSESAVVLGEGVTPDGHPCYVVQDDQRLRVFCEQLAVKRDVEPMYNESGRTSRST